MRDTADGHKSGRRVDKDDLAAALREIGKKKLCQRKWRAHVALIEQIKIAERSVCHAGGSEHACTMDKDISARKIAIYLRLERGKFSVLQEIKFVTLCLCAELNAFLRHSAKNVHSPPRQHETCAFTGQRKCDAAANAAARARDNSNLVREARCHRITQR